MKKLLFSLSFVAMLSGCSSLPSLPSFGAMEESIQSLGSSLTSLEYGSWLDRVGKRPNPPVEMSQEDATALRQEAGRLRAEADAIRVQLASESDRVQRYRFYSEIRKIDDELVPIERLLLDARRSPRTPGMAPS